MRITNMGRYTFTEIDELDLLELSEVLAVIFDWFHKVLREALLEGRSILSSHLS